MASSIDVVELENMILDHSQNGTKNAIEAWNFETNHCEEAYEIIKYPNAHPTAFHIATIYLTRNMLSVFSQFTTENKLNYIQELLNIIQSKKEIIVADNSAAFEHFFATIYISVWGIHEAMYQLINEYMQCSQSDVEFFITVTRIINSICEIGVEKKLYNFQSVCHLPFLMFVLNNIRLCITTQPVNQAILRHLFELLFTISTFEQQTENFKLHFPTVSNISNYFQVQRLPNAIPTGAIVFQSEWPATIADPDILNMIFDAVRLLDPNDLILGYRVLKSFATIGSFHSFQNYDKYNYQLKFIQHVNEYVTKLENPTQESLFELTSLLWYCHQTIIMNFPRLKAYQEAGPQFDLLISNIQQLIITPDNFVHNIGAVQNILWYYSTKDMGFLEIKKSLFLTITNLILDGIYNDEEFLMMFNDVGDNTLYDYTRKLLDTKISDVFPDLKDMLISRTAKFFELLDENPEDKTPIFSITGCISFLVNFSTFCIESITNLEPVEPIVELFTQILDAFNNILSMQPIGNCYVQNSFIIFANNLSSLPFLDERSNSQHFYEVLSNSGGTTQIHNSNELVGFVIHYLIQMLANPELHPQTEIMTKAALSLHKLLSSQTMRKRAIATEIDVVLLDNARQNVFNFGVENTKARRYLHSAIGDILADSSAPLASVYMFLSSYDRVFAATQSAQPTAKELFDAVVDFSGYFGMISTTEQFNLFFNYLFPDKIARLVSSVATLTEPVQLLALMKLWSVILSKNDKIVFRKHSPNGVHFFKFGATLVHSILDAHGQTVSTSEHTSMTARFLVLISRIAAGLLDNAYVPYSAFQIFGDNVLVNLISDCGRIMSLFPLNDVMPVPKLASSILEMVRALCKNHINLAMQSSNGECGMAILECLSSYIYFSQNFSSDIVTKILSNIVNNIENITALDHDAFLHLYKVLWGVLYTNSATAGAVAGCIFDIMQVYPDSIEKFYETTIEFVSDKDEFGAKFHEFQERIPLCEKSTFHTQLSNFVAATKMLIVAPHEAFK